MNDLISIIVPIYNVEAYLKRCVDSILKQTYTNLELILVDDGSNDRCGEMCDAYQEQDARIQVIHKVNGGLSDARNVGIEHAQGRYLMLVDSDDYIHHRMVETLYHYLKDSNADISVGKLQYVYSHDTIDLDCSLKDIQTEVIEKEQLPEQLYNERYLDTVVAVCKLYKKEIFTDLKYRLGKYHEDEFMIHHVLSRCNKVIYVDCQMYYYFQRGDSITTSAYSLKRLDGIEALKERVAFYSGTPYEAKAKYRLMQQSLEHYYLVKTHFPKEKKHLHELNQLIRETLKSTPELGLSTKIRFQLFLWNKSLYSFLKKQGFIKT